MALDKLVDGAKLTEDLTAVADAIREKGGTSEELQFLEGFVEAIDGMSGGALITTLRVTNNHSKSVGFHGVKYNTTYQKFCQAMQSIQTGNTTDVDILRTTAAYTYVLGYYVGDDKNFTISSSKAVMTTKGDGFFILKLSARDTELIEITINPAS